MEPKDSYNYVPAVAASNYLPLEDKVLCDALLVRILTPGDEMRCTTTNADESTHLRYGKPWQNKSECFRITRDSCDLSHETRDCNAFYNAQVIVTSKNTSQAFETERFHPKTKTLLGPPAVKYSTTVSSLLFTIELPSTQSNQSLEDVFEKDLVYSVTLSTDKSVMMNVTQKFKEFEIPNLDSDTEYCGVVVFKVPPYMKVSERYTFCTRTLKVLVSEMEADFDQTLQPSFPREGGSLTLSCEFSSDLLTYQRALLWFKDGVPLPESQRRQLHTGSRSASLTITQVYKEDEGLYSIHLPTLTGVKEQSAYVFVRDAAAAVTGAPGSPLDVECSDINKDYVFLTWKPPSADGGSPVVGYFIDRLDIGSGQWVQCNDAPHNICRFPVVGLREGGIYQFRVRAVNKAGVGRPSKKTEAVTMVDPSEAGRVMVIQLEKGKIVITKDQLEGDILIPLPPTDAHVSEVSGACVVLSWTEPDPRGREPLTYYVEKSVAGSNSWQRANLEIPVHSPRFPIFDLTKGKSYCFRVRAVNKYGVSEPSLPSEVASLRETVGKYSSQTQKPYA
ncbi:UNVERIFIED_CONTAM: hypothetical protein FKN15_078478 [Acipenser sinensis]